MFTHVMVGSNDLEASKRFYDAVFAATGGSAGSIDSKGRVVYGKGGPRFMVTQPINGEPACHANGGTIGFAFTSSAEVDAWHQAGLDAGGTSIENPPGIREVGARNLYLAYLRDPTGNKLCASALAG